MCGIAGVSRANRSSIPNGRRFATALALSIENRGKHATGFGWWEKDDDEHVWYDKRKGRASKVVDQLALPAQGIETLLAHTRHFTKGSPDFAVNNHPVVCDGVVVVHNGRVDNDDDLIGLSGVERVGKVDSFALPALLSQQEALGADHPVELLTEVRGVAALAWLTADDPTGLHLCRLSTRPLAYGYTKRGDFVFASTKKALEHASKLAKVKIRHITEVEQGTYLRVEQGVVTDMREFDVVHPPDPVVEDVPGKFVSASDWWAEYEALENSYRAPRDDDAAWRRHAWGKPRSPSSLDEVDIDQMSDDELDEWLDSLDQDELFELANSPSGYFPPRDAHGTDQSDDGIDWENLAPRRGWK